MAPLAVRAFEQGLDGRFPKEWRENGARYLEDEGRENGMNQALNQAGARVKAGGRKQERKIRRGASEEGGMDGWILTSYSGEAGYNGAMYPLDWPRAAWGLLEARISLTPSAFSGQRAPSRDWITLGAP